MINKKARFGNLSCFPQKNFRKKAQAFSVILVFVTLFMCGSSVYVYRIQQGNVESSLVSPLYVLEVRDNLDVFEMREKELIKKSLDEVDEEFGTDDFSREFKEIFIEGVDGEMREFILSDLMWDGRVMDGLTFDEDSFFRNVLYSKIERGSDGLKFARSKIGKSISLSANSRTNTDFSVDFLFEFEREYLISKKGDEFEVKVVW